jgi:TPR repeat protein
MGKWIDLIECAANLGSVTACLKRGRWYHENMGAMGANNATVDADSAAESVPFFRRAYDLGDATGEAAFELGVAAEYGFGQAPDEKEAAQYYRLSSSKKFPAGHVGLGLLIGLSLFFAPPLLRPSHSSNLRLMRAERGKGGYERNINEAVAHYKVAADANFAGGLYQLGRCYELGMFVCLFGLWFGVLAPTQFCHSGLQVLA